MSKTLTLLLLVVVSTLVLTGCSSPSKTSSDSSPETIQTLEQDLDQLEKELQEDPFAAEASPSSADTQ